MLLKKFRPLYKITHRSKSVLVQKVTKKAIKKTRKQVITEIKEKLNQGNIDPADLFRYDQETQTSFKSSAIYKIGFVGLKEQSKGFITVTFVPKGRILYPPYVLFDQTYNDYKKFITQNSWGEYWHSRYYEKTNYKSKNYETFTATGVIEELERLKNLSPSAIEQIVNKTLQSLIIELTAIEQLQKLSKKLLTPKAVKQSIKLAKKHI